MLELLILTALFFKPCHGYEIKKMIPGFKVNNNTLYPLLKKWLDNEIISMDYQDQDGKPAKKVYSLTKKGTSMLFDMISNFDEQEIITDDAFYLRVAFFQFLPKESVKKILDTREYYLNDLEGQEKLMKILGFFPDKAYDILYLKNYFNSKLYNEKQLVKTLKEKYGIE